MYVLAACTIMSFETDAGRIMHSAETRTDITVVLGQTAMSRNCDTVTSHMLLPSDTDVGRFMHTTEMISNRANVFMTCALLLSDAYKRTVVTSIEAR